MARRALRLGLTLVLVITELAHAEGAQEPESEAAMTEDVRRMHERLTALSRGEGSMSQLRVEFMDASGLSSHRSYSIESGKLVSREWPSPGSAMIQREGSVPAARVSELLQQLIANEYWRFEGTRFTPDAPMFLFRFYDVDLKPVDFRCDAEEYRKSEARSAIRTLFLEFVSKTEVKTVPASP